MAIAVAVVATLVITAFAVILGVRIANKLRKHLGVPELPPEAAAIKGRIVRVLGLYLAALALIGGMTWALSGSWLAAILVVVAVVVVAQVVSLGVRARAATRSHGS